MGIKSFFSKLFGASEPVSEKAEAKTAAPANRKKGQRKPVRERRESTAQTANAADPEGFVEYVVKALVDYPDEVSVSTVPGKDGNGKMIKIVCRPGDRGKIIGKKGKTIMALRALVTGAAGRAQERFAVEVMDDENEVKG